MSSLNSSSSLGSGREGDGRNVVDPEKRTSITMLVLGDGELRFFPLQLLFRTERHMEGGNSSPISFGNGKTAGKKNSSIEAAEFRPWGIVSWFCDTN